MNSNDYTKNGTKIEGNWENDRNAQHRELYTRIIKEVYGADQVIIAHHLVYSRQEDDYFIVEEIPSADTLIFDHEVAQKLWGNRWQDVLMLLAITPVDVRDAELFRLLDARDTHFDHDTLMED